MMLVVYRFFDALNELLYVGSTSNLGARIYAHERDKDWWPEVINIEIESCDSIETMLESERMAIETEYPRYNKTYAMTADGTRRKAQRYVIRRHDDSRRLFDEALSRPDGVGPREIARISGYHERTVHRILDDLVESGEVVKIGYGLYQKNPDINYREYISKTDIVVPMD